RVAAGPKPSYELGAFLVGFQKAEGVVLLLGEQVAHRPLAPALVRRVEVDVFSGHAPRGMPVLRSGPGDAPVRRARRTAVNAARDGKQGPRQDAGKKAAHESLRTMSGTGYVRSVIVRGSRLLTGTRERSYSSATCLDISCRHCARAATIGFFLPNPSRARCCSRCAPGRTWSCGSRPSTASRESPRSSP